MVDVGEFNLNFDEWRLVYDAHSLTESCHATAVTWIDQVTDGLHFADIFITAHDVDLASLHRRIACHDRVAVFVSTGFDFVFESKSNLLA